MRVFKRHLYTEIYPRGGDDCELVLRCDSVPDDALAIVWGTQAECEAAKQIFDYHIDFDVRTLFENLDMIAQGAK